MARDAADSFSRDFYCHWFDFYCLSSLLPSPSSLFLPQFSSSSRNWCSYLQLLHTHRHKVWHSRCHLPLHLSLSLSLSELLSASGSPQFYFITATQRQGEEKNKRTDTTQTQVTEKEGERKWDLVSCICRVIPCPRLLTHTHISKRSVRAVKEQWRKQSKSKEVPWQREQKEKKRKRERERWREGRDEKKRRGQSEEGRRKKWITNKRMRRDTYKNKIKWNVNPKV